MIFDTYKFRCSALGKIWSRDGEISQSNKTYLQDLFVGEMHKIRKEITSKYFEKGKYTEEDGITLLNQTLYPGKLLVKNKERKYNDFIHGEADCIAPDGIVYDIKNAFDRFTFARASLTTDYEWQLRGYMWLWGKEHSRLFYCLNNMPEHLLCAEERKLFYANFFATYEDPEYKKLCEELREKHTYDKMHLYERFRFWDVEHSDKKIEQLQDKIAKCREYLNKLFNEHLEELKKNMACMGLDFESILISKDDQGTLITDNLITGRDIPDASIH